MLLLETLEYSGKCQETFKKIYTTKNYLLFKCISSTTTVIEKCSEKLEEKPYIVSANLHAWRDKVKVNVVELKKSIKPKTFHTVQGLK